MKKHDFFTVLGKPFFSIGAQLHNSSGYALGAEKGEKYMQDVQTAFQSVKAVGANTVAVPVCWDVFEQTEGAFNFDYVKRIIDRIRENDLHVVILWFGTWKNGQMEYTPSWVKMDKKRFPRCICKDGTETTVLSPFYEENREQDKKAFCKLMEFIREYDEAVGTVIAVQVENEPGMYAASVRDFSEKGTEAFEGEVPAELIKAAKKNNGSLGRAFKKCGRKESGSYEEVFGRFGAELCIAWATAKYIDDIACAGKQIYDIFMYVNVWTDRNEECGWSLAGLDYPSGGAVSKVLPAWYAACSCLDTIAPDIYELQPELIMRTQESYDVEGFPFYIPESGPTNVNATMMFEAIGKHKAIGYHIFGAESCLDEDGRLLESAKGIQHSFEMLKNVQELLIKYSGTDRVYTLAQRLGQDASRIEIGDWVCRVSYAGAIAEYVGWVAMDYRHNKDLINVNHIPNSLEEETARGLLFRVSDREFYLVGHKVRLYWQKMTLTDGSLPANIILFQHQAHNMELIRIEEGHFENGEYVIDRLRSGDEGRHGIWAQYDCGVVHFVLGDPS